MSSTSSSRSGRPSSVSASSTSSASFTQLTGTANPPSSAVATSPPGSPCNDSQNCSAPPPATLYLYTFLSTLIILLLVSAGIIARSVVLRRRQRIAIANGTWPANRRRENYLATRKRPVMFDTYVAAPQPGDGSKPDEGEERWSAMKPFSASDIAPPPMKPAPLPLPVSVAHSAPMRQATLDQMRSVVHRYNPFHSPPAPPSPVEPSAPPPPLPPTDPSMSHSSYSPSQVRVAFLVAMPSPPEQEQQQLAEDDDEEELPYLEFGVLDVDVVDLGRTSSQSGEEGGSEPREVESDFAK
ncbi:hypothetical protein C8F04DRAFT_1091565 [Mycena alexandri]|uniref:Uncharacterized protein n=1 Tax=Mycena alexandri TaxID=1745969 RepID=A0AAD6T1U5_9AGAR|nr:hypothetical protein C8F04DRAFT_1091565 [Mycena alexandri]